MMSFKLEIWNISELINLYNEDKLNLNPPYQRNAIWSLTSQKLLVDTVKQGMPIPAFFLQEKDNQSFEMVDGQQRTRALLGFIKNNFKDKDENDYSKGEFDQYKIAVNILVKDLPVEKVREFYVKVNKTGLKLERPELNKAEFFDTSFLRLVTELSDLKEFKNLELFTPSVKKRMFDRDFVEELVALLLTGENDKKTAVDQLFKEDVDKEKYIEIEKSFKEIIEKLDYLNKNMSISGTRFKQKNDFYTLFGLIKRIKQEKNTTILELFENLVKISKGISPSNEKCEILQDYARNCITQSNSKKARKRRIEIVENLLLNSSKELSEGQKEVAEYFEVSPELKKVGPYQILKL